MIERTPLSLSAYLVHVIFSVVVRARDCYWRLLAARARVQLDAQLEENRQVRPVNGALAAAAKNVLLSFKAARTARSIEQRKRTIASEE